jgi:hypothetical protein
MARLTKYRADYHPEAFVLLSRKGLCIKEIAAKWGTHRQKLHEWAERYTEFKDAMACGKGELEAYYSRYGRALMRGAKQRDGRLPPNVTAFIWMTKNKLGWSERVALTDEPIDGLDFDDGSDPAPPKEGENG